MWPVIPNGERSVRTLPSVGPAVAARLKKLGITTVSELIWHLPRTWLDLTAPQPVAQVRSGELAVLQATVRHPRTERTSRRQLTVLRAELEDATGDQIAAVWFNQAFLASQLAEGSTWLFWGTPKFSFAGRELQLQSPKFAKTGTVLPVYPETDGLTSTVLRRLIAPLLPSLVAQDYLPSDVRLDQGLMTQREAVRALHAPATIQAIQPAKHRLALDELVRLFLVLARRRAARRAGSAPVIPVPIPALRAFVNALPFRLTIAQRRTAWEILQDLGRPTPMARLLLGDVGSGKTVVALLAAYACLKAGQRVVWLAPTQLLAQQHWATTERLLPSDVARPALVTAATRGIVVADQQFLIGTHALFHRAQALTDLGLVIIDEQHRFGVQQRRALVPETGGQRPHVLSMSATPIPRSLALTVFGDLDCSFLDLVPTGRKPVITKVIQSTRRHEAYDLVAKELAAGRQAYVVCPTIDPVTNRVELDFDQDSRAATKRFEALSKDPRFMPYAIGLLYGALKAADKQATMTAFVKNELQLLVATSLIEVGIDVPNATVLVVEGADHFGLAQLHQLRGRIGRGVKQSLCVAIADDWSPVAKERLAAFERSTNGFELAELDLQLRGPGDLLGDLQAGLPPLKLASLTDTLRLEQARELARTLHERATHDPLLAAALARLTEEGDGSRTGAP